MTGHDQKGSYEIHALTSGDSCNDCSILGVDDSYVLGNRYFAFGSVRDNGDSLWSSVFETKSFSKIQRQSLDTCPLVPRSVMRVDYYKDVAGRENREATFHNP